MLFIIYSFLTCVYGEIVTLKNGKRFECKIIEKTEESIKVDIKTGVRIVALKEPPRQEHLPPILGHCDEAAVPVHRGGRRGWRQNNSY